MQTIKVTNGVDHWHVKSLYLDVKQIMERCQVSRATAYRYMAAIAAGEKRRIQMWDGRTYIVAQPLAVDRQHAKARPGNPHLTPEHQKTAARARWAPQPQETLDNMPT